MRPCMDEPSHASKRQKVFITNHHQEKEVFPFVVGGKFTPYIADTIFGYINTGGSHSKRRANLLKCRLVSKAWMHYIDNQTSLWGKDVSKGKFCQFAEYGAVDICRHIVRNKKNESSDKSNDKYVKWFSPTNPIFRRYDNPYCPTTTPFHEAARNGHFDIC